MSREELVLDLSKICWIAEKARELDAQSEVSEPDYGSNAIDDGFLQVLEAYEGDATFDELKSIIDDLNWDEQCELVALAWIGRGDYGQDEWSDALDRARDGHNDHTSLYLLGMPMLSDFLDEGLGAFGLSCRE
ncbi:DUF3775 domain-containing protein [Aestuariispira ectoiniformans]|uniref:DUF3775 domain-containing protein n=1 Tax=Aestuariispira ectoiniformans TaxID=2775080 RepID=UPI00223B2704|nr:DUF3775 domain-containing protein [Aestuariispira ectoiniformans]